MLKRTLMGIASTATLPLCLVVHITSGKEAFAELTREFASCFVFELIDEYLSLPVGSFVMEDACIPLKGVVDEVFVRGGRAKAYDIPEVFLCELDPYGFNANSPNLIAACEQHVLSSPQRVSDYVFLGKTGQLNIEWVDGLVLHQAHDGPCL